MPAPTGSPWAELWPRSLRRSPKVGAGSPEHPEPPAPWGSLCHGWGGHEGAQVPPRCSGDRGFVGRPEVEHVKFGEVETGRGRGCWGAQGISPHHCRFVT